MNRQITKRIAADAEKALAAVAKKHGVTVEYTGGKFDDEHCALKFNFAHTTGAGDSLKVSNDWDTLVEGTKLEGKKFGIKFRAGGTLYTVCGVKLSRPVWPIVATGPRGGKYKFKVSHVENGIV